MINDIEIIVLYNNGETITSIAKKLKLQRKRVYIILERNNVPLIVKQVGECECCNKQLPNGRRKKCGTCNTAIRRLRLKSKCVNYKGGECVHCKLRSENLSVYDFHHLDPNEKDFDLTITIIGTMSWDAIKVELDKCILLCSNCHRIEHSKFEKYKNFLT